VIGGEGNGGVIFPELHPGRDAMIGMALILQFLAENNVSLDEAPVATRRSSLPKRRSPLPAHSRRSAFPMPWGR